MSNTMLYPRIGMGLDFHTIKKSNLTSIKICGVDIECDFIIEAHSDGDVGLHALTEAMLGAIANGNIGTHFKNTDPKWKNAPSSIFIEHASRLVEENNGIIINVDITIICEKPKIMPYSDKMCQNLADLLHIKKSQVSVKATTTEGMGFLGREEGIGATAICSIAVPFL